MDEFGSQVSSQLDGRDNSTSLVVLTRNVGFRADRFTSRQMVSRNVVWSKAPVFVINHGCSRALCETSVPLFASLIGT